MVGDAGHCLGGGFDTTLQLRTSRLSFLAMDLHTLPCVFAQTYLELVSELGWSRRDVLRQAGLTARQVNAASGMGLEAYRRLLLAVRDAALRAGSGTAVGIEMGWRLPPTAFGPLGMALLSSATLGDALALTEKYWPLYGMGLTFLVRQERDLCVLEFAALPFVPPDVRDIVLESVMASIYRSTVALAGVNALRGQVWFDFPEPPHAAGARRRLGDVRYGMPATQWRVSSAGLDQPLPMANAVSLRQAIAQCELELTQRLHTRAGLVSEVSRLLALGEARYPGLEEVAQMLSLSSRTLRRRLSDESTSYLELLNQARARDAKALLLSPQLDMQQISERLGYRHSANFARAFKAWTGKTPSAYRKR